jgi:hypothetical protein
MDILGWGMGLAGGGCIGLGAVLLMAGNGRIAGISGITAGLLPPGRDRAGRDWAWRAAFLAGIMLGPLPVGWALGHSAIGAPAVGMALLVPAGLLVGFGTGLGSGCTSGHGVCGLARLSPRSLAATLTFLLFGIAATALLRHGIG